MIRVKHVLIASVLCSAIVSAQGGQGGFGGGGLQGGGDFTDGRNDFYRQLFLSPGDRTEWSFEAKEHDTVLVKVTSSVFDPAVAIHDEKGNKLAENDDIEPGNQMAQLVFAVPGPGKYKAVVTNYKGSAGGAFQLQVQRFLSLPLPFGQAVTTAVGDTHARGRADLPKAGPYVITVRGSQQPQVNVIKANGEPAFARHIDNSAEMHRYRLEVKEPGVYIIDAPGALKPEVKIAPIVAKEAGVGDGIDGELDADAIHDVLVNAKKDDLLQVQLENPGEGVALWLDADRDGDTEGRYVPLAAHIDRQVFAVLKDGPVDLGVRHMRGAPGRYRVTVTRIGKPWTAGTPLKSSLEWFESELWTFDAKPGDVVKLKSVPTTYRVGFVVMDPKGQVHYASNIGRTPATGTTVEVKEGGRYVVHVSAGAVGEYGLTREVVEPKKMAAGVTSGELRSGTPDVWRFSGREGQDMAFRVASKDLRWNVQIVGPDGKVLTHLLRGSGDGDDFARLKLPATGDYTVVVNSSDGMPGAYTMKWVDLDR